MGGGDGGRGTCVMTAVSPFAGQRVGMMRRETQNVYSWKAKIYLSDFLLFLVAEVEECNDGRANTSCDRVEATPAGVGDWLRVAPSA